MGTFFFGAGTGKVTKTEEARCSAIAKRHDARFMAVDMPEGYRYWFETENAGAPWDANTAAAVMAEVGSVKKAKR